MHAHPGGPRPRWPYTVGAWKLVLEPTNGSGGLIEAGGPWPKAPSSTPLLGRTHGRGWFQNVLPVRRELECPLFAQATARTRREPGPTTRTSTAGRRDRDLRGAKRGSTLLLPLPATTTTTHTMVSTRGWVSDM
eukprot:10320922-Heterocapsa_arctica.AAC.1